MAERRKLNGKSILQIGCGGFGATHLHAWRRLGLGANLIVADPDPRARAEAARQAPECRQVADYRTVLKDCAAVDLLTPTDTHHAIARQAVDAG